MSDANFDAIRNQIAELKADRETALLRGADQMAAIYQGEMLQVYRRLAELSESAWTASGAAVIIDPAALQRMNW